MQADSKSFRRELALENTETNELKTAFIEPLSPSKRKHRDSMDSLDSNRASLGSNDGTNRFEDPFMDQPDESAMELEDMSGTMGAARNVDVEAADLLTGLTANTSATLTPKTMADDDAAPPPPIPSRIYEIQAPAAAKVPEMEQVSHGSTLITPLSRQASQRYGQGYAPTQNKSLEVEDRQE